MRKKQKNKIRKNSKIKKIMVCLLLFFCFSTMELVVLGEQDIKEQTTENTLNEVQETYQLEEYVKTIEEYVKKNGIEDIDFDAISKSLQQNQKLEYSSLISKLVGILTKEVMNTLKSAITIFFIIILAAVMSNLELNSKSDITKVAHLVCFIAISTLTIATFIETITMFKEVVGTLTTLMQVISPFMLAILIATGAITSTGIIQPLLLFLASGIGFIVNYIVIPFFSISVALNVICNLSENMRLEKASKMFTSSALWVVGISLTVFLGILSLETSLSSSVDSLAVKTTQAAVSNFVPVVGKFFSDSFETVVGATKIIGKVGGSIGIIAVIIVAIIPLIKIGCMMGIYNILSAIAEPIIPEDGMGKYLSGFANIYKTLFGILIGITILFVISTGIILNLASKVVT